MLGKVTDVGGKVSVDMHVAALAKQCEIPIPVITLIGIDVMNAARGFATERTMPFKKKAHNFAQERGEIRRIEGAGESVLHISDPHASFRAVLLSKLFAFWRKSAPTNGALKGSEFTMVFNPASPGTSGLTAWASLGIKPIGFNLKEFAASRAAHGCVLNLRSCFAKHRAKARFGVPRAKFFAADLTNIHRCWHPGLPPFENPIVSKLYHNLAEKANRNFCRTSQQWLVKNPSEIGESPKGWVTPSQGDLPGVETERRAPLEADEATVRSAQIARIGKVQS